MRYAHQGNSTILGIGIFLITLCFGAFGIDVAYYFGEQNRMQTAADAAALGAIHYLYMDSASPSYKVLNTYNVAQAVANQNGGYQLAASEVNLGYVDPVSKAFNATTFSTPSTNVNYFQTGGYNAVRVIIKRSPTDANPPLKTIMASIFGVNNMSAYSSSIGMMDQTIASINNGGVRPIYACQAQYDQAMADGNPKNNVVRVYGQQYYIDGNNNIPGCPSPGSGNWGFADLRDCSPGAVGVSTLGNWFAQGFPGSVSVGTCYSTEPGNAVSSGPVSNSIDDLIANQTVITLPLANTFNGSGSNTNVNISGFTGFVITDYKENGPANSRYIEGYFTNALCKDGCTSGSAGAAGGTTMVKLRMAGINTATIGG